AVELAREALCRVVARAPDRVAELFRDRLGEAVGRALDDALELVELPALDVGEAGLDALDRLGFFGRDALPQLALSLAQALGDLVQRAAALLLVGLELLLRGLRELVGGARKLGLEGGEPLALALADGVEPLGVELEPRLGLGHQLPLPLGERRELRREPA